MEYLSGSSLGAAVMIWSDQRALHDHEKAQEMFHGPRPDQRALIFLFLMATCYDVDRFFWMNR